MTKAFLFLLIFITSCSQIPIAYSDIPVTIYRSAFGFPEELVSQEDYDSYNYSFAKAKFGKGKTVTLILSSVDNKKFNWVGSDGIKLVTQNGRIIQTFGLPNDMQIITDKNRKNIVDGDIFFEVINFKNPVLLNANLKSSIKFYQTENYLLHDNKISSNVFHENISITKIGWKKKNIYYLDQNHNPLKTIQYIHPFLDEISIEFYLK